MSNSQWHADISEGERALREWKKEQEGVYVEVVRLRAENARLRAALAGLFNPDSLPYAQWTREMHAAAVALAPEDK